MKNMSNMSNGVQGLHSDTGAPGKIAYLTGEYPRATDTFIQREVSELRALGWTIVTCSIRRTVSGHHVGDEQRYEAARTFYVQPRALQPHRLFVAHVTAAFRSPRGWLSALRLAWQTRPPGLKAIVWQIFYFLEAGVLAHHMQQQGVTHLHNHFANSSCSVAMLASTMSGIPFSFTLHGPAIFFEPKWWRIDEKIARARFVACISHFARSQAMLFSDQVHWNKLRIVHCGVIPSRYGRKRKPTANKHVIFIGRLDSIKGVSLLLEAFTVVRRAHPEARLTIVGDGPDRASLEARARDYGIDSAVSFLGYVSQEMVAELLEMVEILVLPSFAEGVPVVLMEAMAASLPVIASNVGGVSELVQDGISGLLVPPGDLETLTARLEALLANPTLRERMGKAGREKVKAEFNVESEVTWLADLLRCKSLPIGLRPIPREY